MAHGCGLEQEVDWFDDEQTVFLGRVIFINKAIHGGHQRTQLHMKKFVVFGVY